MKKFILLAAFAAAGLVGAKTADVVETKVVSAEKTEKAKTISNPDKKDSDKAFQLCGVTVTYYDSNGNPTGQEMFTSDQSTLENCQMWQSLVKHRLQKAGFTLTPQ